ncbi:MAG: SpoIIE family protein phosphatase [Candidatus Eremiobacteraeota bacterium]|nr:SpoIIE family protein phosphatase [Candidatus Eremiobacteraeota bacterium]
MRSLDVPVGRLDAVLDVLLRAGQLLTSTASVPDALTRIAEMLVGGMAEYCSIRVVIEALERDEFAIEAGAQSGQPVDQQHRIREDLTVGRRVYGAILCETSREDGFDEASRRVLKVLAMQLAIVVGAHAAALREHRVADRFQRALLPERLPDVPGVQFHASYRPASDEADVGGDWYDVFALADGRIAVSVGDVAGHGLDAAVIMGEVRQAIRTAAVGSATTPASVLEYVNGVVRLRDSVGMVTAIFGIYDPPSSTLSYAVAGHPPPLLALEGGVTRRLPASGLPLGCSHELETATWTFTIPKDARVVFYTDGLVENDRDVIGGEERLVEIVQELQSQRVADPADAVQRTVFNGVSNRDDAAVLVLERTSPVARYVFSAQPVVSPIARAIVDRVVASIDISDEKRFGVLVAVGEAIANAVEHAYRGSTPGLLRLDIEVQALQLVVTIEDFGRWRPFVRREERGRGIELMHAFMDGVQIKTTRDSTAIVLKALLGAATA